MSRGHLHSPAKEPAHAIKDENGILCRIFIFHGSNAQFRASCVVEVNSSAAYERLIMNSEIRFCWCFIALCDVDV